MPRIEVINTGTELLLGHVVNTHLGFLGQELLELGWRIEQQTTVPDGDAIREAMTAALSRAEIILVTGGLGPTSDDITREIAAELCGVKLIFNPQLLEKIHGFFAKRNITPPEIVRREAMVPEGARILENDFGTASGLILERSGKYLVLLPGPPRELKPMWKNKVVPWLKEKFQPTPSHQRVWRILGVGEGRVQEALEEQVRQIGEFEIGYCSRPGEVDFRLITPNPDLLEKADKLIRSVLKEAVYGEADILLEKVVIDLAAKLGKTIATAESCTGGLVAHRLTNVAGSSEVFKYGWVTYSNEAKIQELGVDPQLLKEHGAVSEPVAKAMAEGALKRAKADIAVALTGIAGPEGGTEEKPAGLLWLGLATQKKTVALKKNLPTDRETYKYSSSQQALDLLRKELPGE